uniref:tRNA pseudouridine(55) synthase n=1 Tax=Ciona intestinalis TaxID=7719 RepID=F6PH90_CIOIN
MESVCESKTICALALKYCPRCIARLLRFERPILLKNDLEIVTLLEQKFDVQLSEPISKNGNGQTETDEKQCNGKLTNDTDCHACLGILRSSFVTQCADLVLKKVEKSSYKFDCYQLLYFLPIQLIAFTKQSIEDFKNIASGETDIYEVKELFKVLLEPLVTDRLKCKRVHEASMEISLHVKHEQSELFRHLLSCSNPLESKSILFLFSEISMQNSLRLKSNLRLKSPLSPLLSKTPCTLDQIGLFHTPVFVAGRYNKYSRTLPQTPWILDGKRKLESSVQELISGSVELKFGADRSNFSSSGREDVDVRMLGRGRPFILELIDPRISTCSTDEMKDLQTKINSSTDLVRVRDLQIVEKSDCKTLKQGEEEKTKSYSALCCFLDTPGQETIEKLELLRQKNGVIVYQNTPIRVLHRRPLASRPRCIHTMVADRLTDSEPRLFKLRLCTQAGTYVKEFVHGDFGRTSPSLRDLVGAEVDILCLDVDSVDVKWPPVVPE